MEYTLIRSRRRTTALEISRDGRLIVRAPFWLPRWEIERFVASRADWARAQIERQQARNAAHPPRSSEEIAVLRRRAKAEIPPLVSLWAGRIGVEPTAITVTAARTRFGSCSGKNRLSFSLYLMEYPPEAVEYVVVHELCHILHHDHSAAFWQEVARYLPDYKARRQLLRQ